MKFDTADLERLASTLETNATVADALAHKHAKAREIAEAEKEATRAKNGRHYAAVCREAARRLKIREKKGSFTPPTWEETLDYAKATHPAWPHADVLAWWNHFESQGWLVSGKAPMRKWQQAADNGFLRWKEKNPQRAQTSFAGVVGNRSKGDPAGWEDFLKTIPRNYKAYRYEMEWIRNEFHKWIKRAA